MGQTLCKCSAIWSNIRIDRGENLSNLEIYIVIWIITFCKQVILLK